VTYRWCSLIMSIGRGDKVKTKKQNVINRIQQLAPTQLSGYDDKRADSEKVYRDVPLVLIDDDDQ